MNNLLSPAVARVEQVKVAARRPSALSRNSTKARCRYRLPLQSLQLLCSLLIIAGLIFQLSPGHAMDCCGGGPPDPKKPVPVTWVIPTVVSGVAYTVTVSVDGTQQTPLVSPVYVAYGAVVTVTATPSGSSENSAKLEVNSGCPDSGHAEKTGAGVLTATLKVKRPETTGGEAGAGSTKLGSVNLNFSMGRTTDGASAGELFVEEPSIAAAGARAGLRFLTNPKVETIQGSGGLRQLKSDDTLAHIVDIASGFEVRFYKPADVGAKDGSGLYQVAANAYYVAWRVEEMGPNAGSGATARLKMSKVVGGVVVAGSETLYSEHNAGLLRMATAGGKRIESKRSILNAVNERRVNAPNRRGSARQSNFQACGDHFLPSE